MKKKLTLIVISITYTIGLKALTLNNLFKLQPRLDQDKARQLHHAIMVNSYKYNLNAKLLTAILFQESSFNLGAVNKKSNDYGIGQINYRTAKHFCPDIKRLLTDLKYSVTCAAKVLHDFKNRYFKKEKYFFTRYNSSRKIKRREYRKKIQRILNVIK